MLNPSRLLIRVTMILVICSPDPAPAHDGAVDLTKIAMKQCELGRLAPDRTASLAHFEQGRLLAEQAVAGHQQSADAHFSLFCNLGEIMRLDGEASLASMLGFRRMMKELDRTLELAPDHLDALSAKGTLLVWLPPFLGGDEPQGEQILRQVIQREPASVNARLSLAKSYCAKGKHDEAIALAVEALHLAETHHCVDFLPEARSILSQLRATAAKAN